MRMQVKNRLRMSKGDIAARREASSPDRASWVWVIPLPAGGFRVRAFEVHRDLLVETDDIWDGNMHDTHDEVVPSIDDVDAAVARAGVDPEALDAPWHCDFPL